jgi:DNA-directed RNA polymerase subunit RPC12/RpoP
MVVKQFECDNCGTEGKISIKGSDIQFEDVVCCPVCGSDIFEEADFDEVDE